MVEIAHLKHCQKQSNLNNLDGKITSTVNLMPEIVSHCVPSSPHAAKTSPFNVSDFLLWPECPLSHSLQMTTDDCQCCYCLLLGFHNNTTVLSPGLLLVSWPPSSLPIGPFLSFLWPLSSHLSASNVNTDSRGASPEHNIAQLNFEQSSGEWKCCKKSEL